MIAPDLELGVINGDGSDDYLLMSPAEGRSVRNPIHWGKDQDLAKSKLLLTTDGEVKIDKNRSATGFGFGAKEPYGLPYPSARCQMQLNAYYQKKGDFYYPSDGASVSILRRMIPRAIRRRSTPRIIPSVICCISRLGTIPTRPRLQARITSSLTRC